jgi:predicted AlkP superfamily phosphohydrolase/phosphomutase
VAASTPKTPGTRTAADGRGPRRPTAGHRAPRRTAAGHRAPRRRAAALALAASVVALVGLAVMLDGHARPLAQVPAGEASGGAAGQAGDAATGKRVIVLGIDGLDYGMVSDWMDQGLLPNLRRLRDEGSFHPLTTSMPPQSPVAWCNFMTGANSGQHGIFDFLHRDPNTYLPFSSMSEAKPAAEEISLLGIKVPNRARLPFSDYIVPFAGGTTVNLRKGTPFWEILADRGVPCVIHRCPVNFPPVPKPGVTVLSGMGTPDIQGTNGTYAFYTNRPPANYKDATGGKIFPTDVVGGVAMNRLYGPPNDFIDYDRIERRTGRRVAYQDRKASIPFTVYVDEENPVAKIVIDGKEVFLRQGEFSPWVEVNFSLLPTPGFIRWLWHDLVGVKGMVRFYLTSVHPDFGLYITPVQISPLHPVMPISYPPEYAAELAKAIGPYYTQGMPEDTKALEFNVFCNADFLKQLDIVVNEETRMADYELARFKEGVVFLYWSCVDQSGHVMWRTLPGQETHPAHVAALDEPFKDFYPSLYEEIDRYVGKVLDQYVDENTYLIVLSDHGFSSWQRSFDLNRWLYEHGYLVLQEGKTPASVEFYQGVDWSKTRAYGLGINGLYVNQIGRERNGIVPPGPAKDELMHEIAAGLTEVFLRDEIYSGPYASIGPDAQIGYVRGYRASDECAVGEITESVVADNTRRWSGDHCLDYRTVPGVLFTNFPVRRSDPALIDIAPTLLKFFGVPVPPAMTGQPMF